MGGMFLTFILFFRFHKKVYIFVDLVKHNVLSLVGEIWHC